MPPPPPLCPALSRNPPAALHQTYMDANEALDLSITLHAKTPLIIENYCILKQIFFNNSRGRKNYHILTAFNYNYK